MTQFPSDQVPAPVSTAKRTTLQWVIMGGLFVFALALCTLVVLLMLRRGPAMAY